MQASVAIKTHILESWKLFDKYRGVSLTIVAELSVLDVCGSPGYASEIFRMEWQSDSQLSEKGTMHGKDVKFSSSLEFFKCQLTRNKRVPIKNDTNLKIVEEHQILNLSLLSLVGFVKFPNVTMVNFEKVNANWVCSWWWWWWWWWIAITEWLTEERR